VITHYWLLYFVKVWDVLHRWRAYIILTHIWLFATFESNLSDTRCLIQDVVSPHCGDKRMARCCTRRSLPNYFDMTSYHWNVRHKGSSSCMHQIMRYTSKTHTLTQIMYTTDYFQGEITLNSMFVSFSITTREHCRICCSLRFITASTLFH
jgi:hypothetical protein